MHLKLFNFFIISLIIIKVNVSKIPDYTLFAMAIALIITIIIVLIIIIIIINFANPSAFNHYYLADFIQFI